MKSVGKVALEKESFLSHHYLKLLAIAGGGKSGFLFEDT